MIQRTLKKLASMIKVEREQHEFADVLVNGVCIDTRKLAKGNLFVPFKGQQTDGHQFVAEAIEKGAAAALWQKDVPNPPLHLPILIVENNLVALQQLAKSYRNQLTNLKIIGITGSNGKTTTKDMVTNLLSIRYKVQKTEGNYNNHIGLPFTILQLDEDTEMAVLEMGMSGRGEIDFLSKLASPDAVMITNIGESHLLDLGSREGIAEAKLEIINGLKQNGLIVYFGDEPLLKNKLESFVGEVSVETFGRNEANTIFPTSIKPTDKGSYFTTNQTDEEYYLPVLGTHNIMNALCAMLVANHFDVPYAQMNEGFKNLKLTQMRMELVDGKNGGKIINDAYNASPTSMKAAIDLIAIQTGYERKIVVLGDMLELGPDEETFHFEIGKSLTAEKVDYVFTYGKLAEQIARGAKLNLQAERVQSFSDKETLVEELKKHTSDGTLILVKASRGMKLEEVIAGLQ